LVYKAYLSRSWEEFQGGVVYFFEEKRELGDPVGHLLRDEGISLSEDKRRTHL
jgi:hypothetical protein